MKEKINEILKENSIKDHFIDETLGFQDVLPDEFFQIISDKITELFEQEQKELIEGVIKYFRIYKNLLPTSVVLHEEIKNKFLQKHGVKL